MQIANLLFRNVNNVMIRSIRTIEKFIHTYYGQLHQSAVF